MSYYGYERLRPGDALGIDMTSITKQLSKDLKAYEEKKGKEKESVAQTNRDFAKLLAKMPSTYSENYNSFFADISNTAMTTATKINNDFKNRNIDKRDYDIKMGNLNTSVGLIVDSVSQYAKQLNEYEKKAAAGELSDKELWQYQQIKDYLDLGNVTVVFDPDAIQGNFVKVNQDGSTDIMSATQMFQTINIPTSGPLDIAGAVKKTLTNLTGVQDITTAEGRKQVGRFIESSEGTQALKDAAEAMLAQDADLINFGTGSIIRDDEGNQVQFDFASVPLGSYDDGGYLTAESLKKLQAENPNIFFQDKIGRFHISDSQRELILKNAEKTLKAAADYTLVEPQQVTATVDTGKSYDRFIRGLELINRAGKKVPKEYIDLLLDSVPGLDLSSVEGIQFEDRPIEESVSERKERLKKERDVAVLKKSNEWYDTVFLTDITQGAKLTLEDMRDKLINTPYLIDDKGKVTFAGDEVFDFKKKNKNSDYTYNEILEFKKKLKAVLDPNQEVFLYYTANPNAMTDEGGIDYSKY